jgi:hypothetical protein
LLRPIIQRDGLEVVLRVSRDAVEALLVGLARQWRELEFGRVFLVLLPEGRFGFLHLLLEQLELILGVVGRLADW